MSSSKSRKSFFVSALLALSCAGLALPALADGLMFDAEHDVFVLPPQELSVRYNNKTFAPVKATTYSTDTLHFLERPLLAAVKLSEDFTNMSIAQSPETVVVECYDSGAIGPLGTNRFSKDFLKVNHVRIVSYPNDKISRETGMPVSALQSMKSVMVFEVKPKAGEEAYNLFALQHDNHMTFFARRMRSGRADVKNDPPVIITEMRVGSTKDSKANVDLTPAKTASEGNPSDQ